MSAIRKMLLVSVAGATLSLGVAGCATQRPDVIPATAQVQTSGNGSVSFTPPTDGMAYIYDQASNQLVWSGPVRAGQTLTVDPQKNQIALGSQVVAMRTLQPGDRHDVYFDPSPNAQPAGMPMERQQQYYQQPAPPPANGPQGTGVNPSNMPPSGQGTTVNGQGVLVTPSVTVTPTNPGQQQTLPPAQQPGNQNPSVNVNPPQQNPQP
ncbi:MAG TPA: hypothetical protein VG269_07020 [Tepidisphaeraceae bacterium]|nr:hypothetical protein [Tepidisphaeraceae bacterium]